MGIQVSWLSLCFPISSFTIDFNLLQVYLSQIMDLTLVNLSGCKTPGGLNNKLSYAILTGEAFFNQGTINTQVSFAV